MHRKTMQYHVLLSLAGAINWRMALMMCSVSGVAAQVSTAMFRGVMLLYLEVEQKKVVFF